MTRLAVGMRSLPKHANTPCGDLAARFEPPEAPRQASLLLIVDGLGHGTPAALAAQEAERVISLAPLASLDILFARLDAALQATRGAAVGLARIHGARLSYAAIGNTRALRWRAGAHTRLPSQYGIVGDGRPKRLQTIELDLQVDDALVLFTDGLDESLHIDAIPPDWRRNPEHLCASLIAHWKNTDDDAAVLVALVRGE